MTTRSSGLPSHRAWIQQARSQSEEAERQATELTLHRGSSEAPVVSSDSFPGYDLEREIHRGAQGVVYRAIQKSTGRRVALKLLHDHAFGGPLERARFEREVRILAALKHPNVVTIYDGGAHDGRVFLVMDYIAGQPLDVYMASHPRPIHETLELFIQICDAVNAAHVRGIIHRDLKPANVRVDASGKPYVLDFGLAKLTPGALDGADDVGAAVTAPTMTGQFLGSLPWAAPEQAEGSPSRVDVRTDVYSLGVLLYQVLTGKFPYPVVGPMKEVLHTIAHRQPASPRSTRHEIDDELETIVLKCLSKERERRYQTAGELAGDIRRYLDGAPIDAKRDSSWYVLRKSLRQHRVALIVASIFVWLLCVSSILAWVLSVRANRAAIIARHAEIEASEARQAAVANLYASLIAQARATRHTGRVGQRFDTLEVLKRAAAISPTTSVRNEVIATLATTDLQLVRGIRRTALEGAFDMDAKRFAAMDSDNKLAVIRTDQLEEVLATIPPPRAPVGELHAIELRGQWLTRLYDPVNGARRLEVWNVPESRLILEVVDVPPRARYDISPDEARLAVGRLDHAIHVYDLQTATDVQRFPLDRDPSYLTYDPTGRRLVLYHANFLEARLLDLDNGTIEPIFESRNIAWSVAWRPDAGLVAGAAGSTIELWDTEHSRRVAVLSEHDDQVVHLMFSHDGRSLISASWDGRAILWDVQSRRPLVRWNMAKPKFTTDDLYISGLSPNSPRVMKLERDTARRRFDVGNNSEARVNTTGAFLESEGLFVVVGTDHEGNSTLHIHDIHDGHEAVHEQIERTRALAADHSGRFLLTAQRNGLFRWPVRAESARVNIGPPLLVDDLASDAVSLSAEGDIAVVGDISDGVFRIIDLRSGARMSSIACGRRAGFVRISPDGRFVAIGMWWAESGQRSDLSVEVWDATSGSRIVQLPIAGMSQVEFSPDSKVLVTNDAAALIAWETGSWRELRRASNVQRLGPFSPDGRLLAISPDDTRIRLLDASDFEEVAALEPPEGYSTSGCVFNGDGTLLAQITNRDDIVHLWDLRAVRSTLAAMALDWNTPAYPAAPMDAGAEKHVTFFSENMMVP